VTDTDDSPERIAQGLSSRQGGDDRRSPSRMRSRDEFEPWLRDLLAADARLRGLGLTDGLLDVCWDEYDAATRL